MAHTDSNRQAAKIAYQTLIRRKNAEADAFFLSIGEGAIATDEYANISRINSAALDILGFKLEDVIGRWFPDVIIAEDADGNVIPNIERPITEAFLTGTSVFKRIWYRKKDGSRIPVAQTVSPVILNGVPIGAVEVFRDITKEVELENAKDEFISIASHQLRTPATVVKQYLGILLGGYLGNLTPEQQAALQTAYEHNDNQLDTISDLLKVAQADSNATKVVRKKTNLEKLLRSVVETQATYYKHASIRLSLKAQLDNPVYIVDPLHIRMVAENLLDNARKYSPMGTSVVVNLSANKSSVQIQVKDQGYGIAAKDLPRLFQKFSRLHNLRSSAGGTGLGLYWAKKLIALHGGTITVTSKLNHGTTFTIKIPAEQ